MDVGDERVMFGFPDVDPVQDADDDRQYEQDQRTGERDTGNRAKAGIARERRHMVSLPGVSKRI